MRGGGWGCTKLSFAGFLCIMKEKGGSLIQIVIPTMQDLF